MSVDCCICHKGPQHGVAIFRINAKGQPGVWACKQHLSQTDAPKPDQQVTEVISILEKRR